MIIWCSATAKGSAIRETSHDTLIPLKIVLSQFTSSPSVTEVDSNVQLP